MVRLAGVMTCLEAKRLHRPNDKLTHKTKKNIREKRTTYYASSVFFRFLICSSIFGG